MCLFILQLWGWTSRRDWKNERPKWERKRKGWTASKNTGKPLSLSPTKTHILNTSVVYNWFCCGDSPGYDVPLWVEWAVFRKRVGGGGEELQKTQLYHLKRVVVLIFNPHKIQETTPLPKNISCKILLLCSPPFSRTDPFFFNPLHFHLTKHSPSLQKASCSNPRPTFYNCVQNDVT